MRCNGNKGFTLVELIAVIAIVAIIVGMVVPTAINYVTNARQTADKQTLAVLNDAINRYKMEGGSLAALTAGKPYANLLTELQTPVSWNGLSHQFLRGGGPYEQAMTVAATGSGRSYKLTGINSYNEGSGTAIVSGGQVVSPNLVDEDFEQGGTPSGWVGSGTYDFDAGAGMNGSNHLSITDYTSSVTTPAYASHQAGSASFIFRPNHEPSGGDPFFSNGIVTAVYRSDTKFQINVIDSGNGGVGTNLFAAGVNYYIWIDYDSRSGGVCNMYVSTTSTKPGTPEATYAYASGNTTTSVALLGGSYWQDKVYHYDDLVITAGE